MGMGKCRSCQAEIIWAKRTGGKAMPLEACSLADGNVRINKDGFAVVGARGSGPYRSHFVSCPQANDWRRGSTGGGDAA